MTLLALIGLAPMLGACTPRRAPVRTSPPLAMRSPTAPTSSPRKPARLVKDLPHALLLIASVGFLGCYRMRRRGRHPASPDDNYLCDSDAFYDVCNTGTERHDICGAGDLQNDHDDGWLALLKRP
jgi:hypothetical protein